MIEGLSVLAIIPARGGSQGLPGKNIKTIGGRPMVAWTIDAARQSRYVDRTILSSDDDAIMNAAQDAGCEVPFRRPDALALSTTATADVVLDTLHRIPDFDLFVLLQPTSPLRSAEDVDMALELFVQAKADRCVSVTDAATHPWLTYELDENHILIPMCQGEPGLSMRRQDLPRAFELNGAIYIANARNFLSEPSFQFGRTVAYEMPAKRSHDIDTPEDFARLEEVFHEFIKVE